MAVIINGKIPAANLTRSVVGVSVIAAAAASADRLARDFQLHFKKPLLATDGYRALEGDWGQRAIFLARYTTKYTQYAPGKVDARRWNGQVYYRKPGTAAAAVPGTSNHGLGLAIDFASGINTSFTSPEYLWMAKHAPAYGWTNTEGRSVNEPWHWVYSAAKDTKPTPPSTDWFDMATEAQLRKIVREEIKNAQATTARQVDAIYKALWIGSTYKGVKYKPLLGRVVYLEAQNVYLANQNRDMRDQTVRFIDQALKNLPGIDLEGLAEAIATQVNDRNIEHDVEAIAERLTITTKEN